MSVPQISNIGDLVRLTDGKIVDHKVQRLTAPGDNYGSLMLRLDITVESTNGIEELHTIAKMVPPNELLQRIFNTQVTFRNEIGFYKKVVPLLQNFQREHGVEDVIDFFAKYYGSRLNLNNDEGKVDSDAALVLENIQFEDYTTPDRLEGLDLDAAKLIIINLALLHAVPLALKVQKPEVFDKEVRPYLSKRADSEEHIKKLSDALSRTIDQIDELEHLKKRILAGFEQQLHKQAVRELFATIIHNDAWTNNNMFKFEGGTAVRSKMVDFQIIDYGSPAEDIVFFIFSSVKNHVVEKHYDELLKLYYETFTSTLKKLKCETKLFTFDALLREIDLEAKYSQFAHLAFMLMPIYAKKETAKELSELSDKNHDFETVTDAQRNKYVFVCNEFARRGWI